MSDNEGILKFIALAYKWAARYISVSAYFFCCKQTFITVELFISL